MNLKQQQLREQLLFFSATMNDWSIIPSMHGNNIVAIHSQHTQNFLMIQLILFVVFALDYPPGDHLQNLIQAMINIDLIV